jgi:hypothetical protein
MFSAGQGYFFDFRYPILLATAVKVWIPSISIFELVAITFLIVAALIVVGFIDLRYIRLHQKLAEMSVRKYNPYFTKLEKSLNRRKS